eukprot:scaffold20740_cov89-Phaeocystis_antarctica.AAC.4
MAHGPEAVLGTACGVARCARASCARSAGGHGWWHRGARAGLPLVAGVEQSSLESRWRAVIWLLGAQTQRAYALRLGVLWPRGAVCTASCDVARVAGS